MYLRYVTWRRAPRHLVPRNQVTVEMYGGRVPVRHGVVLNLSRSGACLATAGRLPTGTTVDLSVGFDRESRIYEAGARVTRFEDGAGLARVLKGLSVHGLEFVDLSARSARQLERLLKSPRFQKGFSPTSSSFRFLLEELHEDLQSLGSAPPLGGISDAAGTHYLPERAWTRFAPRTPVPVTLELGKARVSGGLVNLSQFGMCVETAVHMRAGQTILILVRFPNRATQWLTEGKIVWARSLSPRRREKSTSVHGLAFTRIHEHQQSWLKQLLQSSEFQRSGPRTTVLA